MTVHVPPLSEKSSMILLVSSCFLEVINGWLLDVFVLVFERVTTVLGCIPLVLVIGSVTITPTIVVGTTAVPRAILFWVCSYKLAPGWAWWTQYRKIDRLLCCLIGSEIAYVFTMAARASVMIPPEPLTNGWFLLDSISHFFVLWCLCGHVRCMCKWFEWSKKKVFCYKLVRFFHATLFLVTQLVSTGLGGGSSAAINAAIAYFSVTMVLLHQLFAIVLLAERTLRQKRDQESEKLIDRQVQNLNHDLRTS